MNESDMEIFWSVWGGVLFFLVFVNFYLCTRVFRLLRKDYPEAYEAIGSPSLFLNNTIKNNWLFSRFLRTGRYRELGDDELTRLCRLIRIVKAIFIVTFVGGLLLSFSLYSLR